MFNFMITLIACMAHNRVIGRDNEIPWHIKEDFIHFKNYTLNKTCIMGRKTFLSLNEKPLPKRNNIVLTRDLSFYKDRKDIKVVSSLDEILKHYKNSEEELIVMGGETVYRQALPFADKIVLSIIHRDYEGDTYFPEFEDNFKVDEIKNYDEFDVYYYKRNDY